MEVAVLSEHDNSLDDSNPITESDVPINDVPEKDETENDEQKKNMKFSYFEPVFGIIFAVVAAILFLGFPLTFTVVYIGGFTIPTFTAEYFRDWDLLVIIPGIIWALLRIGVEIAYLAEKRYTKRLAKISVVGNILAAICTFIIFISPRIVNQDYVNWVHQYFANVSVWFGNILANPHLIILFIIMVALILDTVNVIRKGNKAKDKEDEEEAEAEEDTGDTAEKEQIENNGGGNNE